MSRDACIFCQRTKLLVMITKEHLFSRWVDKVLTAEVLGPDRFFERIVAGPDGVVGSKTWPTEVIAAIEAPVVCGNAPDGCNGSWMCDLDGKVTSLMEPMMLGTPRILTPGEQQVIATWAAMKSMVLEYVWSTEQVIVFPQAARTFVFSQRQPPANMQIRIAAVESDGRPAAIFRRLYSLRATGSSAQALPAFASCSTFALGCFVVQTYGTSADPPATTPPPPPHGSTYFVINPPSGNDISWPPPALLDDEGLDQFAHPLQPVTGD